MSEIIEFDYDIFVIEIPKYSTMTEEEVQVFWDIAIFYISNVKSYCYFYSQDLEEGKQRYAINLFTAHLIYTQALIDAGKVPGIKTSASIDKISVNYATPPIPNEYQYQLNTSPYGQLLMLLLESNTAGGFYVKSPWARGYRNFRGCC